MIKKEFTGPSSGPDPEPNTGAKKQVVIKKLIIEDGTVYLGALGVGRTVALPRIEMNDIGEGSSQMTVAEVIDLVLGKVLQSIGPAIGGAGDMLKKEGAAVIQSTAEGAMEKVDDAAKDVGNKVKGLFGN